MTCGSNTREGPFFSDSCSDGVDNDGDGLIDAADPDCIFAVEGPPGAPICSDGIDNDFDGYIDRADSGCGDTTEGPLLSDSCSDGVDNDGDGLIDAADPDCIPVPPPGKHLTYSGSMEGALKFTSGAFANGGFHFKLSQNNATPVTVQVTGNILLPVHCGSAHGPLATGSPITVPVSMAPFTIPANSTSWYLTGDQNNILSWMGAVQAPDLCGGQPMYNSEGATFDVIVNSSAHTGVINFQWHYRVPAAKNKPNTNCTDSHDPNRNRADVCGASWSVTKDP